MNKENTLLELDKLRREIQMLHGENKQLAEENKLLLDDSAKYRLVLKNISEIFALCEMIYDSDGVPIDYRYIDVSPSAEKEFDLPRNLIIGKSIRELWAGDHSLTINAFGKVVNTGKPKRFRSFSKERGRYYEVFSFSLEENKFAYMAIDITTQKIIEKELRINKTSLEQIIDRVSDGFYALDPQWRFVFMNQEAEPHMEKKKEELMNKVIWEVLPHYVDSILFDEYQKAMSEKAVTNFEVYNGHTRKWYEVRAYPSMDGLSVFFKDISEQKKYETELKRLESLNLIGQMAASMGHEIRNPMTTVRGFLQLLDRREIDTGKKEYFKIMIDELDRANSILKEFLSLSQDKTVNLEKGNLNDLLDSIYPLILANALNAGMQIMVQKEKSPDYLMDNKEIRQLVLNLVQNGLDAMTEGGKLVISTFTTDTETVLSIQDEGKGIDPRVLKKLGTPFYTTKEKGTGLGLAICYSIANRHHARIEIDTSSKGSTFFVRFKLP
ncbi:MAG: ATP-binding protein [Bacillota bacterium]